MKNEQSKNVIYTDPHDHHQHDHHSHEHDHNHDHDHHHDEEMDSDLQKNALWLMDNIELTSVGIDIGSSGTQVIFSKLHLRRIGEDLTSRFVVTSRESFFRSPVQLTPYLDEKKIDDQKLSLYIEDFYRQSGVDPKDIDTGAVILTGEAMRRENSQAIADVIADKCGNFVCAAAGHNMEALLAAFGSGAAKKSYDEKKRLLNVDIGGGTTKLAIVENGKVLETAAIYVGGRLVVINEQNKVVRLDPGGESIARNIGLSINIGDIIKEEELQRMCKWMAKSIFEAIFEENLSSEIGSLFLTPRLSTIAKEVDGIIFSGGVGEYVYEKENRSFGDLGKNLGSEIRTITHEQNFPYQVLDAKECIRATVIGASEHSVQVSGNTIFMTDLDLLPKRNLQVLHPNYELGEIVDQEQLANAIKDHFRRFDLTMGKQEVALAFSFDGSPSYERINQVAKGILLGMEQSLNKGMDLIIVLDGDIANTLGHILKDENEIDNDVIVIDGVLLKDFDFIDIGRMLYPSGTVPVTIKSLIFEM